MDDKSDRSKSVNLRIALRVARSEAAEQRDALEDLRQAEAARLEMLEEAIRPIVDQAPADVELFDLGVTHGERPRLFLDMIAFVDLGHDRRTFRFFQDTRHGRVLIAESESPDKIVAAVTNYVARRLVEREQALAADWRSRSSEDEPRAKRPKAPSPAAGAARGFAQENSAATRAARRGPLGFAFDAFVFVLMVLGSVALCVLAFLVAQAAWEAWGRAFWEAHLGAAPF